MQINSIGFSGSGADYEEQRIMQKLRQYGIQPTGNKMLDKNKLREIELREAKKENCVSSKFITVSTGEQEKIQEKKKEKREELNPEKIVDSEKAAKYQGEQIYLAIKMKRKNKN